MHWKCPNCSSKVNFQDQMELVFTFDNEADFDPKHGLYFHTIECDCGAYWITSIGKMEGVEIDSLKE